MDPTYPKVKYAVKYEIELNEYLECEYLNSKNMPQSEFSIGIKRIRWKVWKLISEGIKISTITFFLKVTVRNLESGSAYQVSRRFAEQGISPWVLSEIDRHWIGRAKNEALSEIKVFLEHELT